MEIVARVFVCFFSGNDSDDIRLWLQRLSVVIDKYTATLFTSKPDTCMDYVLHPSSSYFVPSSSFMSSYCVTFLNAIVVIMFQLQKLKLILPIHRWSS